MKEFVLTQSYATIEEMVNSGELDVCRAALKQENIEFYAIVSRIGNRYDIDGNKIDGFTPNPYCKSFVCEQQEAIQNVVEPVDVEIEKIEEENEMKYTDIETLIDTEIEKAVAQAKLSYEQEIANLKEQHEKELAEAKEQAKAELIAKLNG